MSSHGNDQAHVTPMHSHNAVMSSYSDQAKAPVQRTTTGCRTCRSRKIKCGEQKPACVQCQKGQRICEWSGPRTARARLSKRANATACNSCKFKKVKCTGDIASACERCIDLDVECVRSSQDGAALHQQSSPDIEKLNGISRSDPIQVAQFRGLTSLIPANIGCVDSGSVNKTTTGQSHPTMIHSEPAPTEPIEALPLGQLPEAPELRRLIKLYFSSVHQFGYLSFINQVNFNHLVEKGTASKELTLIMIAHALRFAENPTKEILARADAFADVAISKTLPQTYQGFGAVELMILLLAQHYDINRGKFTSAWLLIGNCTRMMQMMSLHSFDRTYRSNLPLGLSPLLSREALRRIAWATFYADSMVDGGRHGFHVVNETSLNSLQLPCDEASFLAGQEIVTEPLFPPTAETINDSSALDMSAFLLRTAAARRRALHFAFRATHKEDIVQRLTTELTELESYIEEVIGSLPAQLHFNTHNRLLHQHRLTTFLLLHVLRHNLYIIVGRAALQIYQRDPVRMDLIVEARRKRIAHALPIAGLIAEGLKGGVKFDPHIGVQAYVALEILLFEPKRLAATDAYVGFKEPELKPAIGNLLTVIRDLAVRSEISHRLHLEAVHRLLQHDGIGLLNEHDISSFRRECRLVSQNAAEYDFREFRWAKLERVSRGAVTSATMPRDEALLESQVSSEVDITTAIPSPRLDAMDITTSAHQLPELQRQYFRNLDTLHPQEELSTNRTTPHMEQTFQPWLEMAGSETVPQGFSLDLSTWVLDGLEPPWLPGGSATL